MTSILLLTTIVMASLLLVHQVNRREERRKTLQASQRRLRWRVDGLEEVLLGLEEVLPDNAIARCINQEILHLLQEMDALEPGKNTQLTTRIAHVEERDAEMLAAKSQSQANRLRESDAQIARTKDCLDQAARVLRRQQHQGRLAAEALDAHLLELLWTKLMVEVVTHVAEGHKAFARGDLTSAQAYYKKAQGLLIGSEHPNPKRMATIRELGEVIQGKRRALSPELMPEDEYNP